MTSQNILSLLCEYLLANFTSVLVTIVVLIVVYYVFVAGKPRAGKFPYPPGPWGFPILGHLPLLGTNPPKTMAKYRQQYGEIFSIRMGSLPAVVINGIDTIRAALLDHLDDFAARPKLYTAELLKAKNIPGLTFAKYTPAWKTHRKISNTALRMFANYRNNPVEEIITEEGKKTVEFFLKQNGAPFDPKNELHEMVGSVIYQIMFGRNDEVRADKNYTAVIKSNLDFSEFSNAGNPVDVLPWTRFILPGRVSKFLDIVGRMVSVYKLQLKNHKETYDGSDLRDVMDALLKASEEITPEEAAMGLTSDVVTSAAIDFLGAGFETVGTTLKWSLLLMTIYPEVQKKVHTEINEHLGISKQPTYEDRKHLPYVEATLLEIQRFVSVAPFGIPHATSKDVDFKGFSIPEGTFVLINQDSTCRDKSVWGDPQNFRPERFLDGLGEVDLTKAEQFLRFGAGKRRCLGELLAKVELFLFFTLIMQRCEFSKVPGNTYDVTGHFGLTQRPSDYSVHVKQRN